MLIDLKRGRLREDEVTVSEAAALAFSCEKWIREKVKAGDLKARKVGRRVWVERKSLDVLLAGRPAAEG